MVWMINKYAFLARSTQRGSPMVMVVMSTINPSIEAYFASISTATWSDLTSGSEVGRYSSLGIKCCWVGYRLVASHDVSARRSFPRLVSSSMMVLYSSGEDSVPKGRRRHRNASFPTIAMHVATICVFAWTRPYAALRYFFPIRILFEGHLMRMDAIVWNILRRHNP